MKRSIRSGALAIAIATGITVVVPLALPASAALKQSATCSKLTAGFVGKTLKTTYSQCTPAALVAGAGSVSAVSKTGPNKGKLLQTLTWKNGKGTTTTTIKYAPAATKGKCATGTSRVTVTGSVTGGTGAAATIIKKGEPLTISICAVTSGTKIGNASLEPGTKFKL